MTGFNLGCVDEVNVDDLKDIAFFDGKCINGSENKILMKLTVECFDKVKKDCLNFIKSQKQKQINLKIKRQIKSFNSIMFLDQQKLKKDLILWVWRWSKIW